MKRALVLAFVLAACSASPATVQPASTLQRVAPSPEAPSASVVDSFTVNPPAAVEAPAGEILWSRALKGVAVWYRGCPGCAAAGPLLRAALGSRWRGKRVRVCAARRCIRVVLSDWCACRHGRRLVDLDYRLFARLVPLSRGVVPVIVEWGG